MKGTPDAKRDVRGIVLLDKPGGMTSNRALQAVKRLFGARKAGHTGSLDPLATGMLPLCFGRATKVAQLLLDSTKVYRVTGLFGIATDTGDADGQITARADASVVDQQTIETILQRFRGDIHQVPPMYSALKHRGRRLYELAREGVEVERQARPVQIHALRMEWFRWPEFELTVRCSKGTYVRTLVSDIAEVAGNLAHVTALRRLGVGPFHEQQMCSMAALEASAEAGPDALDAHLLPLETALADWPRISVTGEDFARLRQGASIPAQPGWSIGQVCVSGPGDRLVAIAEVTSSGELRSRRLL